MRQAMHATEKGGGPIQVVASRGGVSLDVPSVLPYGCDENGPDRHDWSGYANPWERIVKRTQVIWAIGVVLILGASAMGGVLLYAITNAPKTASTTAAAWLVVHPREYAKTHKQDVFSAATTGDIEFIRAYLAQGGRVNARRLYSASMLFCAVDGAQVEMVKYLLSQRADPRLGRDDSPGNPAMSPLALAKQRGNGVDGPTMQEIAGLLAAAEESVAKREKGVVEALSANNTGSVEAALKEGGVSEDVYARVFEYVLRSGDERVAQLACEYTDCGIPTNIGKGIAASNLPDELKDRLYDLFYRVRNQAAYLWFKDMIGNGPLGVQERKSIDSAPNNGYTLLMDAASSGNLALLKYLLSMGANPCLKDMTGHAAMDYICKEPHAPHADEIRDALTTAVKACK